jgi:WD40 repeat protein
VGGGLGEIRRLGPYRIVRPLGAGGMGAVFLAEDPRLQRHVALKVIKPELAAREDVRQRFLHEARAVAALEHDNIVTIYHADEDQGVPFLAMQLLRGESLEACLVRENGPLPVDEILRVGREVAEGLAAAHERGLIHRDIKPANIWLEDREGEARDESAAEPTRTDEAGSVLSTKDEGRSTPGSPAPTTRASRAKILDFGLARALEREDAGLSQQNMLIGTPAYMAPEQAQHHTADARSDLFSLGCVLYRMATGRPPFEGRDIFAILVKIVTEQPPPPRDLNPALPPALADLIVRLLAKRPEDRPESARAVADALRALEEARSGRPSRRRWLAVSAAAMLVAAGVTAWLVRHHGTPPPPEPGTVTFAFDEAVPLLLRQGETERPLDVRAKHSLQPGEYTLRPAGDTKLRRLHPDRFTLRPGEAKELSLRLVGEVARCEDFTRPVRGVALVGRPKGPLVLAASDDWTITLWDPDSAERAKFERTRNPVRCVAVTPDGHLVASAGGGKSGKIDLSIHLWDLAAGADRPLQPRPELLDGHRSLVTALAFAPDGQRLLSGAADGAVLLWDLATGKAQRLVGHAPLDIAGAAFTPDGRQALTGGGDGKVILWDVATGKAERALSGHGEGNVHVAVVPDGRAAASAGADGELRVWDLKTFTHRSHREEVGFSAVAYSPDGRRLLTGDDAGSVRLWTVADLKEIYRLKGHDKAVSAVAFTPDGRRAVSASADRSVRLWDLPE